MRMESGRVYTLEYGANVRSAPGRHLLSYSQTLSGLQNHEISLGKVVIYRYVLTESRTLC